MTRSLPPLALALLALGLALLAPRSAEALNPNHQCTYCHDLHGGWSAPLLNDADPESVCLSCHAIGSPDPPVGSAVKVEVHQSKSKSDYFPFRVTCLGCHNSHSDRDNWLGPGHTDPDPPDPADDWTEGLNIKLIGSRAPSGTVDMWGSVPAGAAVVEALEYDGTTDPATCTYPVDQHNLPPVNYCYYTENRRVVFEQRGKNITNVAIHSFADDDEDANAVWDGPCEVCHTQVSHHVNDGTDSKDGHNDGKTCTNCHKHDNSFLK